MVNRHPGRRLALKANCKPLGYPTIFFAAQNGPDKEAVYAAQAIAKYAGFVVIDTFAPELVYPLLVLRENIYTDRRNRSRSSLVCTNQFAQARQPRSGHDQLQHYLLCCGQ